MYLDSQPVLEDFYEHAISDHIITWIKLSCHPLNRRWIHVFTCLISDFIDHFSELKFTDLVAVKGSLLHDNLSKTFPTAVHETLDHLQDILKSLCDLNVLLSLSEIFREILEIESYFSVFCTFTLVSIIFSDEVLSIFVWCVNSPWNKQSFHFVQWELLITWKIEWFEYLVEIVWFVKHHWLLNTQEELLQNSKFISLVCQMFNESEIVDSIRLITIEIPDNIFVKPILFRRNVAVLHIRHNTINEGVLRHQVVPPCTLLVQVLIDLVNVNISWSESSDVVSEELILPVKALGHLWNVLVSWTLTIGLSIQHRSVFIDCVSSGLLFLQVIFRYDKTNHVRKFNVIYLISPAFKSQHLLGHLIYLLQP